MKSPISPTHSSSSFRSLSTGLLARDEALAAALQLQPYSFIFIPPPTRPLSALPYLLIQPVTFSL